MSRMTPRRVANMVKVISSYYYSKYTKKTVQWGVPISISIEPTTSCNLRCPSVQVEQIIYQANRNAEKRFLQTDH